MGKLPSFAWTGMMLATMALAGCKCCSRGSSCSNGSCSAPVSHSAGQVSQPTSLPSTSSYQSMQPGSNYRTITAPPSNWNNNTRPAGTPVSMPPMAVPAPGQTMQQRPVHHVPGQQVTPAGGADSSEMTDDGQPVSDDMPAPAPVRTTTPYPVPSMMEQLPPNATIPPRPPVSH